MTGLDNTKYEFKLIMISDSGTPFEKTKAWSYTSALEAVTQYNAFVDHGFASCGRTIILIEPTGKMHQKTFLTRGIDGETRERLGYTSPVLR